MNLSRAQREALWAYLQGQMTQEATTASMVFPAAILGPEVSPPTIVRRAWPAPVTGEPKRKRKARTRVREEILFPHSTAAK